MIILTVRDLVSIVVPRREAEERIHQGKNILCITANCRAIYSLAVFATSVQVPTQMRDHDNGLLMPVNNIIVSIYSNFFKS